jgi:hypothetical protein
VNQWKFNVVLYGDKQCYEDEETQDVFCYDAKTGYDFEDDFNQPRNILARILFTLSVIALLIHIFIRRFYQC